MLRLDNMFDRKFVKIRFNQCKVFIDTQVIGTVWTKADTLSNISMGILLRKLPIKLLLCPLIGDLNFCYTDKKNPKWS